MLQEQRKRSFSYNLDGSLRCTSPEPANGCTNDPCLSPDKRTFNCADIVPRTISAYDYDLENESHRG
jgi:hypothetical protein